MGFANLKKRVGDNTIFSKKLLLLIAGIFLLSASFLYAQSENTEAVPVSDVRAEEPEFEFEFDFADDSETAAQNVAGQNKSSGNIWQFVKLILVLILVIACIYAIVWLLKKSTIPNFQPSPYLKKVASLSLAPGKSVFIVSTPSQAFLVGTSDNSVNLIGEISDKELIDSMNIAADSRPTGKPKDFQSILASFFPKAKPEEPEVNEEFDDYFSSAAKNAGESLRQRREQIRDDNKEEGDA